MRGPETLTKYEAEKLVQSACAAMAAELARLRAALAEAERERDEAVSKIREHAEHVNYYGALYSQTELERRNIDEQREFYKDELAKAQTCADEMAALAWKWKYKADCQRATIRALVVAARAMWHDMNAPQENDIRPWPPSETAWFIRRRINAERGQAKE